MALEIIKGIYSETDIVDNPRAGDGVVHIAIVRMAPQSSYAEVAYFLCGKSYCADTPGFENIAHGSVAETLQFPVDCAQCLEAALQVVTQYNDHIKYKLNV